MGRNHFIWHQTQVGTFASSNREWEDHLRGAITRNEFFLHYQPIFNCRQQMIGLEALVRWLHPVKGVIAPDHFIPLAEENGLIIPLNEWVMRTACAQMKAWQNAGLPDVSIAINLSVIQFQQKDLVKTIQEILAETCLHPSRLALELTESILVYDIEYTVHVLEELRTLGVRVFLDDFGTGYSSLSYLKMFPLDGIKIDKSFIRDVHKKSKDQAIVRAIIQLAHTLNLKVVAEGVEANEQFHFLHALNCDLFQGYLLGRPMPPELIPGLGK